MTIIIFLIILSLLVIIHELGHFLVAKKLGIKVEEFGIGFPPRVWSKKIGETLYSINALPIGGFVKLYGEDEAGGGRLPTKSQKQPTPDLKRAFFTRPVWQRAAVVIAGVIMNTVLAFAAFYILLWMSNFKAVLPLHPRSANPQFLFVNQINRPAGVYVERVAENSPAKAAGIKPLVRIVSVNGKEIKLVKELSDVTNKNKGKVIQLAWEDPQTGRVFTKEITPRTEVPKNQGALGVELNFVPVPIAILHYDTPTQKVFSGIVHSGIMTVYSVDILGKLIVDSVRQGTAAPVGGAVAGPLGIYKVVESFSSLPDIKEQIYNYLNIIGLLSISLAFFNVLPIPALDGGRLFFILVEAATGRKVNQRFEAMAHTIGMVVLLTMILLVTFNDIFRFIINAPK